MKTKKYLKHTWVDPRLLVKESQINGKGVFASQKIQKDEVVMVWGGELIPREDFDEEKWRLQTVVPISETHYLGLPSSDKSESSDEYLNHSCDSNTWLSDEVTMVAKRDILAGEEITLDQALWNDDDEAEYADGQKCTCGSVDCRKILTGHDFLLKEVQEKYRGHFASFIQNKIAI